MSDAPRTKSPALKNIVFALISVALFFSLLELALRIAHFEYLPDDSPITIMRQFSRSEYKELYKFDPGTLWSLRPGALYERNTGEHIDSLGFRGPEVRQPKPAGMLRVVCLGDSSTFGLGEPYKDIFEAKLAEYLPGRLGGRAVEVIDAGVVGYTSTQALEHFRRDALPLKPDVVVIMPGAINEVYTMDVTDAERLRMLKKGEGTRRFRSVLLKLRTAQLVLRIVRAAEPRRKKVPRAPLAQFNDDLESFAALARDNGFILVVASPHRKKKIDAQFPELEGYSAALADFARRHSFQFADVRAEYRRGIYEEDLLFRDDFHPTAAGHDIIAQMLAYKISDGLNKK